MAVSYAPLSSSPLISSLISWSQNPGVSQRTKFYSHVPSQLCGEHFKRIGGQMKDTPYMHERDQIGIKEINF